jgi:hypothetical protein
MYTNIIHDKKNSLQNSTSITLGLKYICNFSYFVTYLFQHKYISYVQVHKWLFEFFFKWISLSLKLMNILEMNKNNPRCNVHMHKKKPNAFFLCLWLNLRGGIMCFHPSWYFYKSCIQFFWDFVSWFSNVILLCFFPAKHVMSKYKQLLLKMAQDFTLAKSIENVVAKMNFNLILNVQLIMTLLCLLPLLEIVHVLIKFNQIKDVFSMWLHYYKSRFC